MLLGGREPGVQREDVEVVRSGRPQCFGRVADVPLARQEDQHVARALGRQLGHRGADRLVDVRVIALPVVRFVVIGDRRPVADLHREGPARYFDDGGPEVGREPGRVDGGRSDDHFQVRAPREQFGEVSEQKVDVEAPLVGLVDDDRVVGREQPVPADLGQQDAVGHDLHQGPVADGVGEANRVADGVAQADVELFGQPLGHRPGRDPPRLGVADHAVDAPAELEAHLR